MKLFDDVFRNRRVLITGHTGFKGSWLALWLHTLGADVTGISLSSQTSPNHWDLLSLPIDDHRIDIRDTTEIRKVFVEKRPEIVFHLAAQALVRESYKDPVGTWSTNVVGTANVLEASRIANCVRAIIVITSDKCYENKEWLWGYRETDRLGGYDPYSASKAATELLVASYRNAFFQSSDAPLLATARAGNVIGGGDWSADRLIPDLVRSIVAGQSLEVRSPKAARPWQHVLDALSGYLLLAQHLLQNKKEFADAWNFGPEPICDGTVIELLDKIKQQWPTVQWHITNQQQPHETTQMYLDSAKAQRLLNWHPTWHIDEALAATISWYRVWVEQQRVSSRQQLEDYVAIGTQANLAWSQE